MSGSLAQALARASGIARTAASLGRLLGFGSFGGVQVGSVELQGMEVPESITFGTKQQLSVHRLPGGARVIDAMGPDPANIVWRGIMLGADAADRAAALEVIAQAGDLIDLAWGEYSYGVIVDSFEADYRRSSWIGEYRISCTVLPDPPPGDQDLSLPGERVGNDIGAALGIDLLPAMAEAGRMLGQAQQALGTVGALVPGASGALPIVSALGSARDVLRSATVVADLDVASTGGDFAAGFARTLDAAGRLATGSAALGHVQRALREATG